jgi:hypothetical protein
MSKYAMNRGESFRSVEVRAFACWFYRKTTSEDLGFRLVEEL